MAFPDPPYFVEPLAFGAPAAEKSAEGEGSKTQNGLAPTVSTFFTATQQQLCFSSVASSAQEFLSEASSDGRLHSGGMTSSVSDGRSDVPRINTRGDAALIDILSGSGASSYASEIDMVPQASSSSNHEPMAAASSAGSARRKARGRPPACPDLDEAVLRKQQEQAQQRKNAPVMTAQNKKVVMGRAEADIVTYAASDDESEDLGLHAQPRPAPPLYYGADLTVGSLPSMPELDEAVDDLDEDSECRYAQLSGAQMNMLIETLTKATATAAHDAINRQFVALMPQLGQTVGRDPVEQIEQLGKHDGNDICSGSESGCSSPAGSVSDCCDMRSLESIVAQSILERNGFADSSPSRSRWVSARSSSKATASSGGGRTVTPSASVVPQEIVGPGVVPAAREVDRISPVGPTDLHRAYRQRCATPPSRGEEASVPELVVKTRLQMVRDRVMELTGELTVELASDGPGAAPVRLPSEHRGDRDVPQLFHVCGFVPWSALRWPMVSRLYKLGLLALGFMILAGLVVDTGRVRTGAWTTEPTCQSASGTCWQQRGLLSVFPLVVSVVGTVALSCVLPQAEEVGRTMSMLTAYMHRHDLMQRLRSRAVRDSWPTACTWVLLVVATGVGTGLDGSNAAPDVYSLCYLFALVFVGFFAASLTYCMLYIARALSAMIDRFCCELAASGDIAQAMRDWNVLQAVMLKASSSIEWIFVGMLLAVGFAVPLTLADLLTLGARWSALPPVVPGMIIMSLFVRAFLVAASITDKCGRVPALVNSLCFGPGTEAKRQLLVDYISSSGAGFYVCDVRLTVGMALKFMYMWSIVAFGLATNFFANSGS